jgi:cysteine synthase
MAQAQRKIELPPAQQPGRGKIYESITETTGDTPLVRLSRLAKQQGVSAHLLAKLEFFNPIASVKDRIGVSMVDALEADGRIVRGASTLIEPTSGNTGIALAFVAAARGYRLILVMPENASIERRKMMALLGAELELTPSSKGIRGAIERAELLKSAIPGAVIPQQFSNPANPDVHRRTTAEEIWHDTGGCIDWFVSGVGTGGTITGVGQALKPRRPGLKIVAVEPEDLRGAVGRAARSAEDRGAGCGIRARHSRPLGHRRGRDGREPDGLRSCPPHGTRRRHPGRHLVWSSGGRGAGDRAPAPHGRQEHCGDDPFVRRALPVDSPVRGTMSLRGRRSEVRDQKHFRFLTSDI